MLWPSPLHLLSRAAAVEHSLPGLGNPGKVFQASKDSVARVKGEQQGTKSICEVIPCAAPSCSSEKSLALNMKEVSSLLPCCDFSSRSY